MALLHGGVPSGLPFVQGAASSIFKFASVPGDGILYRKRYNVGLVASTVYVRAGAPLTCNAIVPLPPDTTPNNSTYAFCTAGVVSGRFNVK